jgi:hypothetical protein
MRCDDPRRLVAELACRYVHDVYAGLVPGPVRSRSAWHYAELAYDQDPDVARELVAASRPSPLPPDDVGDHDGVAGVDEAWRPAPWVARVLLLAGLWLTVMYGIQALLEAGDAIEQGSPPAPRMVAIGVACLVGGWLRLKLADAMARARRRRVRWGLHSR